MKLQAETTVFNDEKVQSKFSELIVDADGIRTEVGRKVGNDEVISRINQSAESVSIQANKINIDGVITAVNNNTTTTINGGKITTGTLSASAVKADSGQFNSALIPNLSASKITTGTLQDSQGNTSFNLSTGELDITKGTINLGNGNFTVNNSGEIAIAAGNINVGNGKFYVSPYGIVEMTNLEIGSDFKVNNAGNMWANIAYIRGANCSFTDTFVKLDPHSYTTANQPNLYINGGYYLYKSTWTASSKTIKEKIRNIAEPELNPKNLYDVDIVQFKYVDDFLSKSDQRHGKNLIGFIIEDLEEKFPVAVDKNGNDSKTWSWNSAYLIPPMLKLIQNQKAQIDELESRVRKIEEDNNGQSKTN